MRTDDSLGGCINRDGNYAAYVSTGECRACYKRRKKAGGQAPVANLERKVYEFHDGRARYADLTSDATRTMLARAREAFMEDISYTVQVAEDARKIRNGYTLTTDGRWIPSKQTKEQNEQA